MKTSHFFYFLLAIILFSCNEQKANEQFADYEYENEDYSYQNDSEELAIKNTRLQNQNDQNYDQENNPDNQQLEQPNKNVSNGGGTQMYKIMNTQFGIPYGAMPIPSNWKRSNKKEENVYFEGPGGVKVYNEVSNSFFYSNDAQRNQFAQQNGTQVKPVKNLERFITEDFMPLAKQQGSSFIRQYPLPQLAQADKRNDSYIFKATPENKQYQCMVTEWIDKDGKKSIVLFRYHLTQYTAIGGIDWGYTINGMDASPGAYEEAKNAFINSLVNFQLNPQWVQTNNQYYANMSNQSNAAHQARMNQIKNFGDANTRRHNERMAASDARHQAWMGAQASSYAGQASYVDGIWERQNMTDSNGNQYKVDGYDNNVWINQNNEYIGTDNTLWNPNTDNTTNSDTWNQLQTTDDGDW